MLVFEDASQPMSFQDLFSRHYETIRDRCLEFGKQGLAVVAVDVFTGRLSGILCIAAKVGTANSAIIGRHSMTDLYLDGDASLSLRHLAVVVSPIEGVSDEVRFRIIDLRTQAAFHDENGRRYEGLVAEGPLFVRCGNYALLCLITGDPTAWPERADDAWACIPERVYLQADEAEPDRWRRKRRPRPRRERRKPRRAQDGDLGSDPAVVVIDPPRSRSSGLRLDRQAAITLVQGELGPVRAHTRLVAAEEEPLGSLHLRVGDTVHDVVVGEQALRRGILLGRYERCDIDGSKLLTNANISRVHLLVVEIAGRVYAIDTASTNGTWTVEGDDEVRITALDNTDHLCLGNDLAYVRWLPR